MSQKPLASHLNPAFNTARAIPRWRCAIRNPTLRRASALVFALYLLKGLAWLCVAAWLWW